MAEPANPVAEDQGFRELSEEEGWALLDARAQYFMGISGREFVRRWQAGEYPAPDGTPVMHLIFSLPYVGIDPWSSGDA